MISDGLYLLILLVELLLVFSIAAYISSLLYSSFKGSPYVATKTKVINNILKKMKLKRNKNFLELGSGDGRVVRTAVKLYGVKGTGVDINPLILWIARIKAFTQKVNSIHFIRRDIKEISLEKYDYIYLFLMPELLDTISPRLINESKKGSLIVSHGFKLPLLDRFKIDVLAGDPFPTYYYRVSK